MKVEIGLPPNIEAIYAAFPDAKGGSILYAWGQTIYNPKGVHIPTHLLAHEAVHGMRQVAKEGIEGWWAKYIADPEFRYVEELAAHKVEFAVMAEQIRDRNARAKVLHHVAMKLASPLYGKMRSTAQAVKDIQNALID